MPTFDYIVIKPRTFDLGEGEVLLEAGTRIPGALAETWGSGRAVGHLVSNGILAPVPPDEDAVFEAPAVEVVEDDLGDAEKPEVTFPQHVVAGRFRLSDGTEVQGKAAALEAQAVLDEAVDA